MPSALASPQDIERFIYSLPERFSSIKNSTLVYISSDSLFGRVEGRIFFDNNIILCVQEFLNFELNVIEGYGYEVSLQRIPSGIPEPEASEYCRASYPHKIKLYWYDSFPHPNDPSLASTDPHHKHIPPNIKRHRVPAPDISFSRPNLPFLIEEIERELLDK